MHTPSAIRVVRIALRLLLAAAFRSAVARPIRLVGAVWAG